LTQTKIDSNNNVEQFLKLVLKWINSNELFGSLSGVVIIDPRTEAKYKKAFDDFVSKMEYGSVYINDWGLFPQPWGAFPKHTPEDVQSGIGKLCNYQLYENVQKVVVRNQFTNPGHLSVPKKGLPKVLRRASYFMIYPSYLNFASLLGAVILGW